MMNIYSFTILDVIRISLEMTGYTVSQPSSGGRGLHREGVLDLPRQNFHIPYNNEKSLEIFAGRL